MERVIRSIKKFQVVFPIICLVLVCEEGYAQRASQLDAKSVDHIIAAMTLHEKAMLLVGAEITMPLSKTAHNVDGVAGHTIGLDRLGIPMTLMADGPVGVRISPIHSKDLRTYYCTAFPSSTLLASTWDINLAAHEGKAMGSEASEYGVDVLLTPGINIMRNPLCGRNFEYLSEDPVLSGRIGAGVVNGIQSEGVAACVKHFIANNQQTNKLGNDARISQRALREIYLRNFEICVKTSSPWTMMSSYNKLCGVYTQANVDLLKTVLRDEWHYTGMVMTDWYKKRNTVDQVCGGTDLMMPGELSQVEEIEEAVAHGNLSEKDVDICVKHILEYITKTLSFKKYAYSNNPDLKKNAILSRDVATQGMVLLKNKVNTLPLDQIEKISLFGATAYESIAGGTGSSNVNKPYIVDIVEGLENTGYVVDPFLKDIYLKYKDFQNSLLVNPKAKDWEKLSYFRPVLPEMDIRKNKNLVAEQAQRSDMAIIVIGRGSGEESDRVLNDDFYLTDAEHYLIKRVCTEFHAQNKKVVVILNICGVMETVSWKDLPDAILLAWFPGQECGNAIADVLKGKVTPSGKLPVTFPCAYTDIPSSKNFPIVGQTTKGKDFDYTNYEEGIWVGYRYFSTFNKLVSFPFGYGLSYTKFAYDCPIVKRKNGKWEARIRVTNVGNRSGREVVELYVAAPQSNLEKPTYELKAFAKTKLLSAGESEVVIMTFSDYDIASFDERSSSWIMDRGKYNVLFGSSVDDIRASVPYHASTEKRWKVNRVLAPVVKVKSMNMIVTSSK